VNPIPPHSYTSAVIGCFVLWLGWFGFNPGSTMAVDANAISHIFMTTNTAGIMALLSSTAMSWYLDGKPSLGMSINGCLAGLVAVTGRVRVCDDQWVAHHRTSRGNHRRHGRQAVRFVEDR
jgi:Amt family ammonium transporter